MRLASVRFARNAVLLASAAVALAGCGGNGVLRTLGLVHDAPDEFTVTTRAPLAMPPDFTLPVPKPGVSRPQEQSERAQAEQALVPQEVLATTPAGSSLGQQALVQSAGPPPPADIRAEVDQAALRDQSSGNFFTKLQFWRKPPPPGIVVDPAKEAQRLRENAALGQSQETGDTPIIQPKQPSILDGLF